MSNSLWLQGSLVHEILQARILEWISIPISRGSSWLRDQTGVSCIASRFYHLRYQGTKVQCKLCLLISFATTNVLSTYNGVWNQRGAPKRNTDWICVNKLPLLPKSQRKDTALVLNWRGRGVSQANSLQATTLNHKGKRVSITLSAVTAFKTS